MLKKIIEKIFCIKIFTHTEYATLTDRVAECGRVYRKYDNGDYHHGDTTTRVKMNELSKICLVENLMWDDVEHKIHD